VRRRGAREGRAPVGSSHGFGPLLVAAAGFAVACAAARPAPAAEPALDCASVREATIRACVAGFRADVQEIDEDSLEFLFAIQEACPYAGAIAWSGCHRGAFERFAGRSGAGRCADEADYLETSILTSCMRRLELPALTWNALVKRCFGWAEIGSAAFRARCDGTRL
jgi:hypothetical protein